MTDNSPSKDTLPGPDCLQLDEVEELKATGQLPADRAKHVDNCDMCRAVYEIHKPYEDLKRVNRANKKL